MVVENSFKMDLAKPGVSPVIYAVQSDEYSRGISVSFFENGLPWNIPVGESFYVAVRYNKSDGTRGYYDELPNGMPAWSAAGNVLEAWLAPQMFTAPGAVEAQIQMVDKDAGSTLNTFSFTVFVEADPADGNTHSEDYISLKEWFLTSFLPLDGGKMSGSIDMGQNALSGIPAPVNDDDAVPLEALNNAVDPIYEIFPQAALVRQVVAMEFDGGQYIGFFDEAIEILDGEQYFVTLDGESFRGVAVYSEIPLANYRITRYGLASLHEDTGAHQISVAHIISSKIKESYIPDSIMRVEDWPERIERLEKVSPDDYEELIVETVIDVQQGGNGDLGMDINFAVSETYTVIIDDTVHTIVCEDGLSLVVGNVEITNAGIVWGLDPGSYRVVVAKGSIKPLENRFIPPNIARKSDLGEHWELLCDTTTTEEVTKFAIDKDMDGNPFSCRKIVATMTWPDVMSAACQIWFGNASGMWAGKPYAGINTEWNRGAKVLEFDIELVKNEFATLQFSQKIGTNNFGQGWQHERWIVSDVQGVSSLTKFFIENALGNPFPVGTRFIVWGCKA